MMSLAHADNSNLYSALQPTAKWRSKAGVMSTANATGQQPVLSTAGTCRVEEESWSDVTGSHINDSNLYSALQPPVEWRKNAGGIVPAHT